MKTDILIVGGGLSGLSLARQCQAAGMGWQLVEGRHRLGGRIHTETVGSDGVKANFDLGPAWIWDGQPRIDRLLGELGLTTFAQYSDGGACIEEPSGAVRRGVHMPTMRGSKRISGGCGAVISAIGEQLDSARINLSARITNIDREDTAITAQYVNSDGTDESIHCQRIILAIPPRLAAEKIEFSADFPETALSAMRKVPTWMAGHAKCLAVYDRPFWREAGLSGDAFSRAGPMVQIHDASSENGGPYALFGFLGVPAAVRAQHADKLQPACIDQLQRIFGKDAKKPVQCYVKDWALDDLTSCRADDEPPPGHPTYGMPRELSGLWNGQLQFASTEVASTYGGLIEGALEASEFAFASVQSPLE